MKNNHYQYTGTMAVMLLAVCATSALGAEVDAKTGVEQETVLSLIQKGGPVMYPLGLASILAFALGLERLISLSRDRVMPSSFLPGLSKAWGKDSTGREALSYCDKAGGTVGHIFKAGIRRIKLGREAVEKAIDDVGSRETDKMKRSLRPLRYIATVAPLLGLLGTVYGMIKAFQVTSVDASTTELARGIYEALVTTAAGLTIAIPVLLFYHFLSTRVDRLIDDIDEAGAEFVFSCEGDGEGLLESVESVEPDEPEEPVKQSAKKGGKS